MHKLGPMQSYLLQMWESIDITIIFITHDLEEAIYLADRIFVLGSGSNQLQEIVEIPVSRPRKPDQFLSSNFVDKKALRRPNNPEKDQQLKQYRLKMESLKNRVL